MNKINNNTVVLSENERINLGTKSAIIGLFTNLILFLGKFTVGSFSASVAITADAFNNLSDAGSSLVTLVGFGMSKKPADEEHPFGHGRSEYIAGFIVSFLILLVSFEIFTSSVDKIFHPTAIMTSTTAIVVLVVSIVAKLALGLYYKNVGKKINSLSLIASMTDSISDVIATSAILISVILNIIFKINIDGYMGAIVSVLVFMAGISSIKSLLNPLLGQAPPKELVKKIKETILSYDGVLGIHDLIVHNYGPNRYLASVHVEVSSKQDILISHDLIDTIEKEVAQNLNIAVVIHMDPIVTDDEKLIHMKQSIKEILATIDSKLSFHDVRMVNGATHTNVIFDVVVPHGFKKSNKIVKSEIVDKLHLIDDKIIPIITIEQRLV